MGVREIIFRGKRVDNGEWVYGDLLTDGIDYTTAIRVHNANEFGESAVIAVIPETVGQYTDLTDKNGKKIFEGDIVEFTDKFTGSKGRAEIVFEDFKWKYSGCYYGGNPIVWLCIDDGSIEFEVIGNIHDNPELLKGEEV